MKEIVLNNLFRHATQVILAYKYPLPLHKAIQHYFSANKKLGSKDRRAIRAMVYAWFRIGRLLPYEQAKSIALSYALLNREEEIFLRHSNETTFPSSNHHWLQTNLGENFQERLFGFKELVSNSFDSNALAESHLNQPKLWLWCAEPASLKQALTKHEIPFVDFHGLKNVFGLDNGFNLDTLPSNLAHQLVVQDISSQVICSKIEMTAGDKVWDCCAASGGKSLKLKALNPFDFDLYVSDIRQSIIDNLHLRFKLAKINAYHYQTIDLLDISDTLTFLNTHQKEQNVGKEYFDRIVVDAPCSGSGTWTRTPEHLAFFDTDKLHQIQNLQKGIIEKVWPFLKAGGKMYYITCSVFSVENEEVIKQVLNNGRQVLWEYSFEGYAENGDCMYMACMQKK